MCFVFAVYQRTGGTRSKHPDLWGGFPTEIWNLSDACYNVVGIVVIVVLAIFGDNSFCIAFLFLRNGALSARGCARRQVWRSSVFVVVCGLKRAFPWGGSKGKFQTLRREKGAHNTTQQPQFVASSPAHTQSPPSFPIPHPNVISVLLIIFARRCA